MKILIITNHSYMYWRFRKELTEALLASHEVVISTPFVGHEQDIAALGCRMIETEVDRRGMNPKTDLKLFFAYRKLLKAEKPDLVITYSIKPNVYGGLACRLARIPYCANVQGLGTAFQSKRLAGFVTLLYKTALKKAKTTFFENEENAREFRDRGIQSAAGQTVLPGAGVNLARYAEKPRPENHKPHFLYLGRIMREKGMDELFSAVRTLHAEGYDFVLDLVGFYEDEYKEQVERLSAEGIAVFHGFQSEPRPYYEAADCVVLPSYHEGMSNVLLEAAATGRAIIASDIPGCREAVKDGESGYLVAPRDSEALAAAMRRFCERSEDEKESLGKAGRRLVEERFDKALVVQKTMEALFECSL